MTGMTVETSNAGSVTSKQSQWWMTVYYFSMYPRHAGIKVMLFVWEQDCLKCIQGPSCCCCGHSTRNFSWFWQNMYCHCKYWLGVLRDNKNVQTRGISVCIASKSWNAGKSCCLRKNVAGIFKSCAVRKKCCRNFWNVILSVVNKSKRNERVHIEK